MAVGPVGTSGTYGVFNQDSQKKMYSFSVEIPNQIELPNFSTKEVLKGINVAASVLGAAKDVFEMGNSQPVAVLASLAVRLLTCSLVNYSIDVVSDFIAQSRENPHFVEEKINQVKEIGQSVAHSLIIEELKKTDDVQIVDAENKTEVVVHHEKSEPVQVLEEADVDNQSVSLNDVEETADLSDSAIERESVSKSESFSVSGSDESAENDDTQSEPLPLKKSMTLPSRDAQSA